MQVNKLKLTEPNPPQKEGSEYVYALFEPFEDMHVDNAKHNSIPL